MSFLDDIAKKHKQPIFRPADTPAIKVESYPTRIATLDKMLRGGIPKGRMTQIYGDFSTLKTVTALLTCASALDAEPERSVLYFDFEHSITPDYMETCGIAHDHPRFYFTQPSSPETAVEMAIEAIDSGQISVVVFDSVAAMQPKAIYDASVEAAGIGVHAKMMGKATTQLTPVCANHNTAIIWLNQTRVNLSGYGSPITRPGGRALDFNCDLMLHFKKARITGKNNDDIIGTKISVTVEKSKVSRPFQTSTFDMFYDSGVDFIGSYITVAVEYGMVQLAGAWYSYDDVKVQGKQALVEYFTENPDAYIKLVNSVKEKIDESI